jgi:WD40 repeat protein
VGGGPIPLPLEGPATSNNYSQVSPDGKLVAACSNEQIFVWQTPADTKAKPKQVAAFDIPRAGLFRFSPDGTKLAVTAEGQQPTAVLVCDIKTGKFEHMEDGVGSVWG